MISVIVPVYNVENYLPHCIDSILEQSYKDFEIILVDDGSSDGSADICDRYAHIYDNIRVIHKKNGGLSSARNAGIEAANGEYVIYIDSDDYIDRDSFKDMIRLADRYHTKVVLGEIQAFYENEDIVMNQEEITEYCISGMDALKEMLYGTLHGASVCGMLIDTELARRFLFPEGKYHEDDYISFNYYIESDRIAVTTKVLYYYLQRRDSIMHRSYGQTYIDEMDAADALEKECAKYGEDIRLAANAKKFYNYRQVLYDNPDLINIDSDTYARVEAYMKSISNDIIKNPRMGMRNRIRAVLIKLGGCGLLLRIHKKGFLGL